MIVKGRENIGRFERVSGQQIYLMFGGKEVNKMEKRAPAMGIYRIQDGLGRILGKACTGTLPIMWKLGVAP